MEEEIDIYADLPNFNIIDNENLAEINKNISEKCSKLEKQVADLTESLESLRKTNKNLEVNISSLLQTAKAEVARKDRMIASLRTELDDIQFRRRGYSYSAKSTRRNPPKKKTEVVIEEEFQPVVPEITETIEIVSRDQTPRDEKSSNNVEKVNRLSGIVNTVFGERLRKKILESQEEEERRKEEERACHSAKANDDHSLKKIVENCTPNEKINLESCRSEDIESNFKLDGGIVKTSSFSVNDTFAGDARRDRKRRFEDRMNANNPKRLKYNRSKSGYHDGGRRGDEKLRDGSKNSRDIKPGDKCCEETGRFHDEARTEGKSLGMAAENETEDRHNKVAMRLLLLSEGIDPDIRSNDCVRNEGKKVVEEKRQEQRKSEKMSVRSRSKSRGRESKMKRENQRSQSITPQEYYKSVRGGKRRDNRQRDGKDRFDRHRDSKNKDGDNLSEFSREILDLKERFEQRIGDRTDDRARRGGSYNRHKKSDEKIHRNGRSRTPDINQSGRKERMVHKSRDHRRYGKSRSRSQERRKSRNSKERRSSVDVSIQNSKSVVSAKSERNEVVEVASRPKGTNAETKSLVSLEDGEIMDSAGSSPKKLFDSVQCSAAEDMPFDKKSDSSDPANLDWKDVDAKSSLPLRDIGNRCGNDVKSSIEEKQTSNIPESNRSVVIANDCLNSSRDERIENIAEFIANFTTPDQTLEPFDPKEKIDADPSDGEIFEKKIDGECQSVTEETKISEEKLESVLSSTDFTDSMKHSDVSPPLVINENHTDNADDNEDCEDWCLIAIDSPVKNFEENRHNRIMAINAQVMEDSEPLTITPAEILLLRNSTDASVIPSVVESSANKESEGEKIAPNETTEPLLILSKNDTPKTKPVVPRALRSFYHKGRRKMVLSDTNSEEMAKMLLKRLAKRNFAESERNIVEKCKEKPQSPGFANVDQNCNISEDDCTERRSDDVRRNDDAVNNFCNGEPNAADSEPDSSVKKDVESKTGNNERFEMNEVMKTCEEAKNAEIKTCKVEKSKESRETNIIGDSLDIKNEPAKLSVGEKVLVADKKLKKEFQKTVVSTRRRKPVHLEDNSTSLDGIANSRLSSESINNCERIVKDKIETLLSVNIDNELPIGSKESPKSESFANDDD